VLLVLRPDLAAFQIPDEEDAAARPVQLVAEHLVRWGKASGIAENHSARSMRRMDSGVHAVRLSS